MQFGSRCVMFPDMFDQDWTLMTWSNARWNSLGRDRSMTRLSTILTGRKEVRNLCYRVKESVFTQWSGSSNDVCVYVCVGPRPQLPIEGPWRHASLKGFLKNVDAGKEETGKNAAYSFCEWAWDDRNSSNQCASVCLWQAARTTVRSMESPKWLL